MRQEIDITIDCTVDFISNELYVFVDSKEVYLSYMHTEGHFYIKHRILEDFSITGKIELLSTNFFKVVLNISNCVHTLRLFIKSNISHISITKCGNLNCYSYKGEKNYTNEIGLIVV